jgi:hypothetical protein
LPSGATDFSALHLAAARACAIRTGTKNTAMAGKKFSREMAGLSIAENKSDTKIGEHHAPNASLFRCHGDATIGGIFLQPVRASSCDRHRIALCI